VITDLQHRTWSRAPYWNHKFSENGKLLMISKFDGDVSAVGVVQNQAGVVETILA
jgi:hypothetical protein